MTKATVRFLQPGSPPKELILPSFEASLGEVLQEAGVGGGKVPPGQGATVNGRSASGDSKVKPGDTVALQPNANHG